MIECMLIRFDLRYIYCRTGSRIMFKVDNKKEGKKQTNSRQLPHNMKFALISNHYL